MKELNVTELRANLLAYLRMIEQGEELLLTSRGKAIARLLSAADVRAGARKHLALLRRTCRIGDVVTPPAGRMGGGFVILLR